MDQDTKFVITLHENASVFSLTQEQLSEIIREYKTAVVADKRVPDGMNFSSLVTQLVDRLFQKSNVSEIKCPYKISLSYRKGIVNVLIVYDIPDVITIEIRQKFDDTLFDNYVPPKEQIGRYSFQDFVLRNFMVSTPTVGRNVTCRGRFVYARYGKIMRTVRKLFGLGFPPNKYF